MKHRPHMRFPPLFQHQAIGPPTPSG